jgi:oligosaccharide repeat unit polymerase
MLLSQSYREGGRGFLAYFLIFPSLLILGVLSGSKALFLSPIISAMILHHYLKNKIRIKSFLYLGALVIIIIPIFNIYRSIKSGVIIADLFQGNAFQLNSEFMIRHTMARFYGIDSLTLIVRDTPSLMEYQLGNTIWPLLVAWIPRQLWEDKPIISFGKIFSENYLGEFFGDTGVSASPTILGELYLNWHILGIFFGVLISGVLLRFVYSFLIQKKIIVSGVFIYSQVFIVLFTFWEASIAGMFAQIGVTVILLCTLVFLIRSNRRTQILTK